MSVLGGSHLLHLHPMGKKEWKGHKVADCLVGVVGGGGFEKLGIAQELEFSLSFRC